MELKLAAEKLHVQDVSSSMGQTEAFRLMMKEKESLIAERYKLNDTIATLRRHAKAADDRWNAQKAELDKAVEEKAAALEAAKSAADRLRNEQARLKVGDSIKYIILNKR